jgi:hypothetical protein
MQYQGVVTTAPKGTHQGRESGGSRAAAIPRNNIRRPHTNSAHKGRLRQRGWGRARGATLRARAGTHMQWCEYTIRQCAVDVFRPSSNARTALQRGRGGRQWDGGTRRNSCKETPTQDKPAPWVDRAVGGQHAVLRSTNNLTPPPRNPTHPPHTHTRARKTSCRDRHVRTELLEQLWPELLDRGVCRAGVKAKQLHSPRRRLGAGLPTAAATTASPITTTTSFLQAGAGRGR